MNGKESLLKTIKHIITSQNDNQQFFLGFVSDISEKEKSTLVISILEAFPLDKLYQIESNEQFQNQYINSLGSIFSSLWVSTDKPKVFPLNKFIRSHYNALFEKWQLAQQHIIFPKSIYEQLLNNMQDRNTALIQTFEQNEKERIQLEKIQAWIENNTLSLIAAPIEPYQFYKGTTDWILVFEGEPIGCTGRYHTGLSYIHALLRSPDVKFKPMDLEFIKSGRRGNLNPQNLYKIQVSESFSIELPNTSPESEVELNNMLKILSLNPPEKEAPLPKRLKYLAQKLHIVDSLLKIRTTAYHIDASKQYKEELEDLVFEFEQTNPDKLYLENVLKDLKIIKKPIEYNKQTRRTRQRVSKSIRNAIEHINSLTMQDHLNKTITTGAISCYSPSKDSPIDWKLFSE